nr:MAG: nonstructural polyprotein [Astroviridae sp.]
MMETQGMSRLAPGHGTAKLFLLMKEKFGTSKAWATLMKCDAIILQNMNSAIGFGESQYWQFEATRRDDGWDLKTHPNAILTEEDKKILRAQASNQMRLRLMGQQSAERAQAVMELSDKVTRLRKDNEEKDAIIKHLSDELKLMRKVYRDTREDTVQIVKQHNRLTASSVVIAILAFIFLFTLQPVSAEILSDCTREIEGCYLDSAKTPTGEKDFTFVQNVCYGKTTTRIASSDINITKLMEQCAETLKMHMPLLDGKRDWVPAWCHSVIRSRLHPSVCQIKSLWQNVEDFFLNNMQFEPLAVYQEYLNPIAITGKVCHLVSVLAFFYNVKTLALLPYFLVALYTKTPMFLVALAVTFLPPITNLAIMSLIILPETLHMKIYFVHWLLAVAIAVFVKREIWEVSLAVFSSVMLPFWQATKTVLVMYEVPPALQLIFFILTVTMSTGFTYLNSTITITTPDGRTEKLKRMDLYKTSLRGKLVQLQNAVRGIIPEIPSKAMCIARVRSTHGEGVAFRFMNNLYTIGHVVGEDKIVEITWNGLQTRTQVIRQEELFEAADTLVVMKLPPECQSMKPLRLSKLDTSDYVQLLMFKDNEPATATGWAILDGLWLSTPFETKPGDSGAPYVDRNARLLGIHLGTQGIVAAGYILTQHLKPRNEPQLSPINEMPEVEIKKMDNPEPTRKEWFESTQNLLAEMETKLLERLIEGQRKSHAAILAKVEQLTERIASQENIGDHHAKMMLRNLDIVEKLTVKISDLEARLTLETTAKAAPIVEQEKKKKVNKGMVKSRFMKMKVLTEEQYRQMLEEGWSREEIEDAVNQLRERAWAEYQMDLEEEMDDYYMDDDEFNNQLESYIMSTQSKTDNPTYSVVIQEAKRRVRTSKRTCPHCSKDLSPGERHNLRQCKMNTKQTVVKNGDTVEMINAATHMKPKEQRKNWKGTQNRGSQ